MGLLFFGALNIDLLRGFVKPFCLSPDLSVLQVAALDYLLGMYPIFLILIVFVFVKLHDNFRVVVLLCSPFRRCFAVYRKKWDAKSSLVDAFSSFILLSYFKILNVSSLLLTPTILYTVDGAAVNTTYLYHNGTLEMFGEAHKPYGVMAIVFLTVFNVFPIILLFLYPTCCFQKCLNCYGSRCQVLHTFMDSFQGSYRHNCRYFSVVYFLIRIFDSVLFGMTLSRYYLIVQSYLCVFGAILVALVRPYKNSSQNIVDIIILLCVPGISLRRIFSSQFASTLFRTHVFTILFYPMIATPIVYIMVITTLRMLPKKVRTKLKNLFRRNREENAEFLGSWPHRLTAPSERTSLLSHT